MKCENDFYIYQKNGECTLDEIELDTAGRCTSFIMVNISPQALERLKEKTFRDIENRYR